MTLIRGSGGLYEVDYRYKGHARLHLSLGIRWRVPAPELPEGKRKAAEILKAHEDAANERLARAQALHDAGEKLFRQNRRDLIAQLRLPKGHPQKLTLERLADMVERHEPLTPLPEPAAAPAVSLWGTVQQLIDQYLEWLDAHHDRAKATHTTARSQLVRFARYASPVTGDVAIGELRFDRVTSAMVEDYQASLLLAKTPPNTVRAYMARVGSLWKWAEKREGKRARDERRAPRVLFSPFDPEAITRERTARDRTLTEDEAERLLAAAPEPLLFPVACGLFTGMRLDEVLHLRPDLDVDLELWTLAVRKQPSWKPKTKNSVRVVPIAEPLRPILLNHLARYASERWVTPSLNDQERPLSKHTFRPHFVQIVQRAGMVTGRGLAHGVTFHTLRHTFASWLVRRGVDLYTVAKLLGDSLATTEATYAHLSPDVKRAAVAKLTGAVRVPELAAEALQIDTASDTETETSDD